MVEEKTVLVREWEANVKHQNICIFSEHPEKLVHSFLADHMKNEHDIPMLISKNIETWSEFPKLFHHSVLSSALTNKIVTSMREKKKHAITSKTYIVVDANIFLPESSIHNEIDDYHIRNQQFRNLHNSKEFEELQMNGRHYNVVLILVISKYFGLLKPSYRVNSDEIFFDSKIQEMPLFHKKDWIRTLSQEDTFSKHFFTIIQHHNLWMVDLNSEELKFVTKKNWKLSHIISSVNDQLTQKSFPSPSFLS